MILETEVYQPTFSSVTLMTLDMAISDNLVDWADLCTYLQKNNILSWFQPGPLGFSVARRVHG